MESASAGACNLSDCLCPWGIVSGSGRSGHSDNAVFGGVRPSAGARVARGQERHSAALSSRRLGTQAREIFLSDFELVFGIRGFFFPA